MYHICLADYLAQTKRRGHLTYSIRAYSKDFFKIIHTWRAWEREPITGVWGGAPSGGPGALLLISVLHFQMYNISNFAQISSVLAQRSIASTRLLLSSHPGKGPVV